MKPEYERLKKDIVFEESQIDVVIEKIEKLKKEEITEVHAAALATYLMNFYNGIENIMKRCAKEYYKKMPREDDWHKKLLQLSSSHGNGGKITIFSTDAVDRLYSYLIFRHFFIHGYGFKLDWEKMRSLVENAGKLWTEIKKQLAEFMDSI